MSVIKKNEKAFSFWRDTLRGAKYVVAPMVDQSELPWRMLCRRYHAELCYSPMFHASNFVRDANYRKEALLTCKEDRPLIIQFCANNSAILLEAARLAEPYCDAVDLNLGCPQCIAKRGHYGAFLQDEWDLVTELVKVCADNLNVPITCKIRVFESIEKTVQYAECIQNAGCELLTVHGRTREQKGLDTGLASWAHIKAVRERLSIPVFANGNIQYFDDIERCLRETGAEGVMVAEGNLHNPALFSGKSPACWEMVEEYLSFVDKYPCPVSYIRGHVFKLNHHALQVHTDIRDDFSAAKSLECFKLANLRLKELCLKDAKERSSSTDVLTDQGLAYWVCQPYVRPRFVESTKPAHDAKRELLKRPLEKIFAGIDMSSMSKKKIKRMIRYPHKVHDPKQHRTTFEKCTLCDNTKGSRCAYSLCKCCCRVKTIREILDCSGHSFMTKTKTNGRLQYEAKVKELSINSTPVDLAESTEQRTENAAYLLGHARPSSDSMQGNIDTLALLTRKSYDTCEYDEVVTSKDKENSIDDKIANKNRELPT